jgi:anti-sigma-K factor RskA
MVRFAALRDDAVYWQTSSSVLAVAALALLVAALIRRPPPDLSTRRIVAVLEDGAHHPAWAIRLAPAAHQIEADSLAPQPVPPGRVYQLWLSAEGAAGPRQLGLLPQRGRKTIPVTPEDAQRLSGTGRLEVTLEPAGGSRQPGPTGRVMFGGALDVAPAECRQPGNMKSL